MIELSCTYMLLVCNHIQTDSSMAGGTFLTLHIPPLVILNQGDSRSGCMGTQATVLGCNEVNIIFVRYLYSIHTIGTGGAMLISNLCIVYQEKITYIAK